VAVDPEAVARRLFGVVLRHLRTEAGLSLRELGKRCHHDYSRLSRMETGEHLGDPALLAEIDRILGAGGLLTVLRAATELPFRSARPGRRGPCGGDGTRRGWCGRHAGDADGRRKERADVDPSA
jgi:Helix-turn-helix domain